MSFLNLDHLQKSFGATKVVHDFNLSVDKGEFVSFLGPSGCGKTTVLRMVAGFETPSEGQIVIDGQDVTRLNDRGRARLRRAGGIARKRIRWAKALVVVLPMLGLWGAVDGLIRSFSSMAVCTVRRSVKGGCTDTSTLE